MRNFSIYPLNWKNPGSEFDDYMKRFDGDDIAYYLTGNASFAEKLYKNFKDDLKIIGYIGRNTTLSQRGGGGVFKIPENDEKLSFDIKKGVARILCAEYDYEAYLEQEKYWGQRGAALNEQFFQAEVFKAIYEVYRKDFLSLDRVEIFFTSVCTMNCEKCIAYIPYFPEKKHVNLEKLKQDADILFSKVDEVKKLKLLGGEVFLYPNLTEYLIYLNDHYAKKIGSIRLGTNGTLFPEPELLKICRDTNVTIDISDYRVAMPEKCKLDEVKNYIESYGVPTDIKRVGEKWLDTGFPNNLPPKRSDEENDKHFHRCAMFCRQYSSGKLYYCCSNFSAVAAGLFPDDENNYFDLTRDFGKKELLEFELGYNPLGHLTLCEVCRGGSTVANPMQIEIAKQARGRLISNFKLER